MIPLRIPKKRCREALIAPQGRMLRGMTLFKLRSGMRDHLSTFPWLLAVVLFWSLAYGGMEYLLKNFYVEPLQADPGQLLEDIVGFMSVGSVIAYALGGAVSSMGQKRTVVFVSGILTIVVLLLGHAMEWSIPFFLVISSILLGFFYGLFAVVRSIMIATEILKTELRATIVNGFTNVAFTVGIIASVYIITRTYEIKSIFSLWVVIGLIVFTCILAIPLKYSEYEVYSSPLQSLRKFWREMLWIIRRMYFVLIPSAVLWGIITVVGVWSLPYAQEVHGIPESQASLILLIVAVGIIIGNIISMRMTNRWFWFCFFTYAFAVLTAGFTILTSTFVQMILYALFLGVAMGAATNLSDSYYLRFIAEENVKENGAALRGLIINGSVAFFLLILKIIPESFQPLLLGCIAVAMGIFVHLRVHTIKKYE